MPEQVTANGRPEDGVAPKRVTPRHDTPPSAPIILSPVARVLLGHMGDVHPHLRAHEAARETAFSLDAINAAFNELCQRGYVTRSKSPAHLAALYSITHLGRRAASRPN
jgi:hypothetical protein